MFLDKLDIQKISARDGLTLIGGSKTKVKTAIQWAKHKEAATVICDVEQSKIDTKYFTAVVKM